MRSKEEIQAKLDSLKEVNGFEASTQRSYLQLGLEKDEKHIKSLITKYSMRIMHEEYELREDKIILDTLNWINNEVN